MEAFVTRVRGLPTTFWFVPAILVLSGLILGELLVALDRSNLPSRIPDSFADLMFASGSSGATAMVTTVGTAVFGVAGTAFSITISVIATASSTYGPRLVRNFMADRGNQVVLGTFGGTFAYCLMVLRRIRSADADLDPFVPQLAVNATLLLAVLNVALLIYFIHHIAASIEVSSLTDTVRTDLTRAIDRLYPETRPDRGSRKDVLPTNEVMTVRATKAGFVTAVFEESLRRLAVSCDSPIRVAVQPGDHALPGHPLAYADGMRVEHPDDFGESVRSLIPVGPARTPDQDIRFCLSRVTEMAVRAMSPGTNDPYTAVQAVHELATALNELARRPEPWPGVLADAEGQLPVLVVPRMPRAEAIGHVFDELRPWVVPSPMVTAAVIELGAVLLGIRDRDITAMVTRQLGALAEKIDGATELTSLDRDRLSSRIADLTEAAP